MNWFLIALINPIAHSLVNHLDKYLISKYIKGGSVGTLILFSSLFSVVALPIIYIFKIDIFATITLIRALILMLNGAVLVLAIMCYLYALDYDEASYVAPFFQLVPVFSFFLGFFILGETLVQNQILAALLIIGGSLILSLEFSSGKARIKKQLVFLMMGSSFCYALYAVIFKSVAIEQGFLDSLFWDMLGKVIFGAVLFLTISTYRNQFINLIKSNRFTIIGLNIINEILALLGETAIVLAVLFAPVVLVESVGGLQPIFVLLFGILITLFFPKIGRESLETKALVQKVIAIIIITIGVFVLSK